MRPLVPFLVALLLTTSALSSFSQQKAYTGNIIGKSGGSWNISGAGSQDFVSDSLRVLIWSPGDVSVILYYTDRSSPNVGKAGITIRIPNSFVGPGDYTIADSRGSWRNVDGIILGSTEDVANNLRVTMWDTLNARFEGSFSFKLQDVNRTLTATGTFKFDGSLRTGFKPNVHGFAFSNTEANMWPSPWSSTHINYNLPLYDDIRTLAVTMPDVTLYSNFFPDWELYAKAFGDQAAYYSVTPRAYKFSAVTHWLSIFRQWRGSCFGFTVAALVKYGGHDNFDASYLTTTPPLDAGRELINRYFLYQYGKQRDTYIDGVMPHTPRETISILASTFKNDPRAQQPLAISGQNAAGVWSCHSVVPRKIVTLPDAPGGKRFAGIYLYDPNYPGDSTRMILVNLTDNRWSYGADYLDRDDGLWTDIAVSAFPNGTLPIIPKINDDRLLPAADSASASTIYLSTGTHSTLTHSTATLNDTSAFQSFAAAGITPIIPAVGGPSELLAYYIPEPSSQRFSVKITGNDTTKTRSSSLMTKTFFARSGFQDDAGNAVALVHYDVAAKSTSIRSLTTTRANAMLGWPDASGENAIVVSGLRLNPSDSIRLALSEDLRSIKVTNPGAAKTYTIDLFRTSAEGMIDGHFTPVQIGAATEHEIRFGSLDSMKLQPISILIDEGSNGTVDRSDTLTRAVLGVNGLRGQAPRLQITYVPFSTQVVVRITDAVVGSELRLIDRLGREIEVVDAESFRHCELRYDTRELTSGLYFWQIRTNEGRLQSAKMLVQH